MSAQTEDETIVERCVECEIETDHLVAIELVEESDRDQNREFSREPYRRSTCTECGHATLQRMNNA